MIQVVFNTTISGEKHPHKGNGPIKKDESKLTTKDFVKWNRVGVRKYSPCSKTVNSIEKYVKLSKSFCFSC